MSPPPQTPTHNIQTPHHRLRHNPRSATSPANLLPSTNRPLPPNPTPISQAARIPQIATPPPIHLPPPLHAPAPPLPTQQPQSHRMDVHPPGAFIRSRKSRRRPLHPPRTLYQNPSHPSRHLRIRLTGIRTLRPSPTPSYGINPAPNGSLNPIVRKLGKSHPESRRSNSNALPLPHRPHRRLPFQKNPPAPSPPLRSSRDHFLPDRNAAACPRSPQHPGSESAYVPGADAAGESGLP